VLFGRIEEKYEGAAAVHRVPRLHPVEEGSRAPFDHRVRALLDRAVRLVDAGVSILVRGEVGCGKEAFAREVHAESRRRGGPFVMVDCSEENAADLERSLFGTAVGGGALEAALGGCLFLHTVEVLPLALQARLVRALAGTEDDDARPPGRDFDLLSSSHWGLADRVAAGGFSADLMIRLAAHTIELEPLRFHPDRRALIREIWQAVAPPELVDRLPEDTLAVLAAHGWPGNRRQLIATLRSLVVLAEAGEPLVPEVLPHEIRQAPDLPSSDPSVGVDVEEGLGAITLAAMRAALEAEGGNVSRAARRLGIHRSTLYRRLQNPDAAKP
ncbi:MAG: sigma-54-dependent Fis family transcriptional regulator, partial [Phyllobacteriaceae bacterium]|nr:sigma-54-dependent Fis family transcriptional regulator [Phyllobacteriaceae bacterium]